MLCSLPPRRASRRAQAIKGQRDRTAKRARRRLTANEDDYCTNLFHHAADNAWATVLNKVVLDLIQIPHRRIRDGWAFERG